MVGRLARRDAQDRYLIAQALFSLCRDDSELAEEACASRTPQLQDSL